MFTLQTRLGPEKLEGAILTWLLRLYKYFETKTWMFLMISRTSKPWWNDTDGKVWLGFVYYFSFRGDEVLQHWPAPESGWAGAPPSWPNHNAAWRGSSSRCRWPSRAEQRWSGCRKSCPSSGSHMLWEFGVNTDHTPSSPGSITIQNEELTRQLHTILSFKVVLQ